MKLYVLGSNGWIPGENETSCILVEDKNELIMLDAGTGVLNLRRYMDVLERYDRLNIVLSHYHLDHIIGLTYLIPFVKDMEVHIYGPGRPYYDSDAGEILRGMFRSEFFSRPLEKIAKLVHIHDYSDSFEIGDVSIDVHEQKHSAPSFRISVDESLIYATDTAFMADVWNDISDDAIVLHECWEIKNRANEKHTSIMDILEHMPKKLHENVYLIHLNPMWSERDTSELNELIRDTGIRMAYDGLEIVR